MTRNLAELFHAHRSQATLLAVLVLAAATAAGPTLAEGTDDCRDIDDDGLCDATEDDPPVDEDDDGVPDAIEEAICGSEFNRNTISNETQNTGNCDGAADYEPRRSTVLQTPVNVVAGPDADGDRIPRDVTVAFQRIEVDRRDPHATTEEPDLEDGNTVTVQLDSGLAGDDTDPDHPPFRINCRLAGVTTVEGQSVDGDDDGFPAYIAIGAAEVCTDQRTGTVVVSNDGILRQEVDPEDDDPDHPSGSTTTVADFPVDREITDDRDGDTIVDGVWFGFVNRTFDSTDPAEFEIETYREFGSLDPDDRDADEPTRFLEAEDDDGDFVFDEAEIHVCLSQRSSGPAHRLDGICTGVDYHPPRPYQAITSQAFSDG